MPDPKTEEMQLDQARRESTHRNAAEDAQDEHESTTEERRADRAAYLRQKLNQRARSEDESE